jgi:tight adherence protein C
LTLKFVQAGNPAGWDADKFLIVRFITMIVLPVLAYLAFTQIGGTLRLVATAVGGYMGYFGPSILLDSRIESRQTAIRKALPDTIDLLTISVEAGLGFDAALRQVIKSVPGELSEEMSRTLQEMQLGVARSDAFRNLKERTQVEELRGFTLAIIQADAFGISIANVLRAQSDTMRMKRKQRTEERAMKIPVKILFPVVFCVLPTLFIVVLGPGIIRMADNFFG